MFTYNKNFQLSDRATRIWNLVAPMKFLVAPGKRADVNVEPWSCKLTSFVSFRCFVLLWVDVQLSGLKRFRFSFFAVSSFRFSSSFVNDTLQCWDRQNQHICLNHYKLLILVLHKALLKLSSCPLQFSLFLQCNSTQLNQFIYPRIVA